MVALVNFGNFERIGDKTVGSGIASGLDTKSIVEALVEARGFPAKNIEDKIETNTKMLTAYSEMTTLLKKFQTATVALKNSEYFGDYSKDSFMRRQVFLTSSDGGTPQSYLGISTSNGASIGKYNLSINNIAKPKSQVSGSFASNSASVVQASSGTTNGMFKAGSITINGTSITLTEGDSLAVIASKINLVRNETFVSAEIIKVSSTDYRLQLRSDKTGTANAYTLTDATNRFQYVNFTVTSAEQAEIAVNGITISRDSNVIDDIVSNVTFSLYQETPIGVSVTAEVAPNLAGVMQDIKTFVGAYNDFKMFAARQQERDPNTGLYKEEAVLAGTSGLKQALGDLFNELSYTVSGVVSSFSKLSDVAITFTDFEGDNKTPEVKNIMTIDEAGLQKVLESNFTEVRKIFEFQLVTSSDKIMCSERSNSVALKEFTIDVDTGRSASDKVRIYYDDNGITRHFNADYIEGSGGGRIVGRSGTLINGLEFYYAGDGTDSIEISLTQGIADRVYNALKLLIDEKDGLVTNEVQSLSSQNTSYNNELSKLSSELELYRYRVLEQYSLVETAISKVNSILQLLDVQIRMQESMR